MSNPSGGVGSADDVAIERRYVEKSPIRSTITVRTLPLEERACTPMPVTRTPPSIRTLAAVSAAVFGGPGSSLGRSPRKVTVRVRWSSDTSRKSIPLMPCAPPAWIFRLTSSRRRGSSQRYWSGISDRLHEAAGLRLLGLTDQVVHGDGDDGILAAHVDVTDHDHIPEPLLQRPLDEKLGRGRQLAAVRREDQLHQARPEGRPVDPFAGRGKQDLLDQLANVVRSWRGSGAASRIDVPGIGDVHQMTSSAPLFKETLAGVSLTLEPPFVISMALDSKTIFSGVATDGGFTSTVRTPAAGISLSVMVIASVL